MQNDLPGFLLDAICAETEFPNIDQDNWPDVACAENRRFKDEAHLRLNLIDYLLKELKDPETPVLKECRCPSGGIADYFVHIGGDWLAVEAKQNVLAEPDILGQVEQYTEHSRFRPTQGEHKNENFGGTSGTCLIVDQSGIYMVSGGRFSNCSPGSPVWLRDDLDHDLISKIRSRIQKEHEA